MSDVVCGVKFKTVAHKPQFIFDESQTSEHLAIFIVFQISIFAKCIVDDF